MRPFCSCVVRFELHFGVIFIAILGTAQASQPSQSQRSGVTSLHGFFSNEVTHSFPFTMAVGYPKRGKRAGVKTRAEEAKKQFNIPVISSPCFQYANLHLTRGVAGLEIATNTVANATKTFNSATKNSSLAATLATMFL